MSDLLDQVLSDLAAETGALDAVVSALPPEQWRSPTPAAGWDIATQIAHLAWTDEAAVLAATRDKGWAQLVLEALSDPDGIIDSAAISGGAVPAAELLARWRRSRAALVAALRAVEDDEKIPWFGPPMSPASMATARFMETWAHSHDVFDALGVPFPVTNRMRHVAHLGVRTRGFAFAARGMAIPGDEFWVQLTAPSGEVWSWGRPEAKQRIFGPAYDFCRLVTQRIHRADTALVAEGSEADRWLDVAQAFAGPPGPGRPPRDHRPPTN